MSAKEAAAAHDRGLDLFVAIPAIYASVFINNSGKQFIHQVSPSG
ncbi:MAG: hypothetical protein ACREYE_29845 [Gammaproteobacteria bacterium]